MKQSKINYEVFYTDSNKAADTFYGSASSKKEAIKISKDCIRVEPRNAEVRDSKTRETIYIYSSFK
jgi:hypothetical protein